ncbi:hypothetical protein [Deinococcus sp.]|uniref:hypothetical protein n=1 Tax=Deinococcus sp. TaxID=47478 RepID=UPI003CC6A60B
MTQHDAVQDAIRKIEQAKRRKAGLPPLSEEEVRALALASPETPTPKRKGRPPGSGKKQAVSAPAVAAAAVSQLTAHTPLGLLEVQESADLDALLADRTLAPHIALRLDERFALVSPGASERLLAALKKAGHTPRVEQRE